MGRRNSGSKKRGVEKKKRNREIDHKKMFTLDLGSVSVRLAEAKAQGAREKVIKDLEEERRKTEKKIKEKGYDLHEIEDNMPENMKKRIQRAYGAKKKREEEGK